MSDSKVRAPAEEAERSKVWLGRGHPARARPWAYEEQLLAPLRAGEPADAPVALAPELSEELAELTRIEVALQARALSVAGLQQRMDAFTPLRGADPLTLDASRSPTQAADMSLPPPSTEREYWLCRCEGFAVESAAGRTGVVKGVRFLSRVDQPDLLEVRAGLFARRLLLVPAEEVEAIFAPEKRIVLRSTPRVPSTLRGRVGKPLRFSWR
jgi:hypothetical protein